MSLNKLLYNFNVDHGELGKIPTNTVFAMGVEYEMFRRSVAANPEPFLFLCISSNAQRLERLAEEMHRYSECRPTDYPGWAEIWVGDKK